MDQLGWQGQTRQQQQSGAQQQGRTAGQSWRDQGQAHTGTAQGTQGQGRVAKKRSQTYLKALRQLDLDDPQSAICVIREELAEVETPECTLVGLLSQCYLTSGHDVHEIDMQAYILRHFKKSDMLPEAFQSARTYALLPQIFAVEVYSDGTLLGVYLSGQVEGLIPEDDE